MLPKGQTWKFQFKPTDMPKSKKGTDKPSQQLNKWKQETLHYLNIKWNGKIDKRMCIFEPPKWEWQKWSRAEVTSICHLNGNDRSGQGLKLQHTCFGVNSCPTKNVTCIYVVYCGYHADQPEPSYKVFVTGSNKGSKVLFDTKWRLITVSEKIGKGQTSVFSQCFSPKWELLIAAPSAF
jgi:hypothetical protein